MHRPQAPAPSEHESLAGLVGRLGNDVRRIVQAEVGLVQARAGAIMDALRAGGILIGLGLCLALGGLGALVAGIVLVVSIWLQPWAAALVVGGGLLLIAALLLFVQARVVKSGVEDALAEVRVEVRDGY